MKYWKKNFLIDEFTLDPRPESELIVEIITNRYTKKSKDIQVLDIGAGSGCLGLSIIDEILDSKLIGGGNMNDPFYRSAAERAMRAVRHPSCKKVKVPSKKYDSWKDMTLNFDPIIMQGLKK